MRSATRSTSGFTLFELLIGLAMTVLLVIGVLGIFDLNNRATRAQMQLTEMQQSLRFAQHDMVRAIRSAGRGGLPGGSPAASLAAAVRNNVSAGERIAVGAPDSPTIAAGTDALTVRGVFESPVYLINDTASGYTLLLPDGVTVTNDPRLATSGSIDVCLYTTTGTRQDLEALLARITLAAGGEERNDALILQSPLDSSVYGVVEYLPSSSTLGVASCPVDPDGGPNGVRVAFRMSLDPGSRAGAYRALSPAPAGELLPGGLTSVAFIGLLEEYRFYIRDEWERAGDPTSELAPRLSRARFYANTEIAYPPGASELQVDIADNIIDLQVALGYDSANLGSFASDLNDSTDPALHVDSGQDDEVAESADGTDDDWLYNAPGEAPGVAPWTSVPPPRLLYVRLTTLARTDRRDPDYVAPLLVRLEDRIYTTTETANQREGRLFRRRALTTVIDMRNVS
jgi:Tfp pilus assembly protein FimT